MDIASFHFPSAQFSTKGQGYFTRREQLFCNASSEGLQPGINNSSNTKLTIGSAVTVNPDSK
jgi:hypothetical protein